MVSFDDARALLASRVQPLAAALRPLAAALGCRLAASPHAAVDYPAADVSAMDGYAVRGAQLPGEFGVAFTASAGHPPSALPAGAAARIFTGAPLPVGADTVVVQEVAETLEGGRVRLPATAPGANVRRQGEVFAGGTAIAAAAEVLTPARLALLAAAGVADVVVTPRPRLGLLVTGDELTPLGQPLAFGHLYDSNGPMLAALAAEAHLEVTAVHRVGDEPVALRQALAGLAGHCDLLLTSGGVSQGERDLLPHLLPELGAELAFHKVAMQPTKPILVARLQNTWVVGLPGNPVSALVGWRLFARPLAEALAGDRRAFAERPLAATLAAPLASPAKRLLLRPARVAWTGTRWEVEVIPWQGSHDLAAAAPATALARLERGQGAAAGEVVAAYPLPWPEWNIGTRGVDG